MTGFFKRWRWALGIAAVLMASLIFALRPQPVLVDVGRVSRGPMAVSIRDDGVTRAEDYYIVSAPVTGYMSRIDMDVGDTVRKNDRIATLIGTPAPPLDRRTERELQAALVAARANTQAIQASLLQAERDFDRAETLAVRGFFPKARLEQSRSTVASLKAMAAQAYAEVARIKMSLAQFSDVNRRQSVLIRAPVSGTVLAILTESEGTIAQGTPLVTLGDPAQIEAVVDLISREAAQVQRGAHVLVTQWGGNEPIKGRVARVEPVGRLKVSALGIEEQRVNVIIRFDRSETRKLKKLGHGYQIDAEIFLWQRQNVIRVPIAALFRDEGGHWQVFAIQNGRAAQRTVRLGHINEDYGEVLSGLEADLPVILNPTRTLQNDVRVKARSSIVN